jgi:hypothetical protein
MEETSLSVGSRMFLLKSKVQEVVTFYKTNVPSETKTAFTAHISC